jgi:hypothetical protein
MGLLKGPLTFSRFMVVGELPSNFTDMIHQKIRRYAFQDMAANTQEKIMGWTGIENVLDTDFSPAVAAQTPRAGSGAATPEGNGTEKD